MRLCAVHVSTQVLFASAEDAATGRLRKLGTSIVLESWQAIPRGSPSLPEAAP